MDFISYLSNFLTLHFLKIGPKPSAKFASSDKPVKVWERGWLHHVKSIRAQFTALKITGRFSSQKSILYFTT